MKSIRLSGKSTLITILTLLFMVNVNLIGCSKTDKYPNRPGQKEFTDSHPPHEKKGPEPDSVLTEAVPYSPDVVRDQEAKILGFDLPAIIITGNEVQFSVTLHMSDNKKERVTLKGYTERDTRYGTDLYRALMQDTTPNSDGKQRLKAIAVCLDGSVCQSMFIDLRYMINGVERRRQFSHIVEETQPPVTSPNQEEEIPGHGHFEPNDPNNPYMGYRGEFVGLEPADKEAFNRDLLDLNIEPLKEALNIQRQKQQLNMPIVTLPKDFLPEILPRVEVEPIQQNTPPVIPPGAQPQPQQQGQGQEAPPQAPVAPYEPQQRQESPQPQPTTPPQEQPREEEVQPVEPEPPKPTHNMPIRRRSHAPSPMEMPDSDIFPEGYKRPPVKRINVPTTYPQKPQPAKPVTPPAPPVVTQPKLEQYGPLEHYGPPAPTAEQLEQQRKRDANKNSWIPIQPAKPAPAAPVQNPQTVAPKAPSILPIQPQAPKPAAPQKPAEQYGPPAPPAQKPVAPFAPAPAKPAPPVVQPQQPPVQMNTEFARPQVQNPITTLAGLPTIMLNLITGGKASGFYGFLKETDVNNRPLQIGRLIDASAQPLEGIGFKRALGDTGYRFGTGMLVDGITTSAQEFRRLRGYENNTLMVYRISSQYGGAASGHGSHQNGLDVDIAYLRENDPKFEDMRPFIYNNTFDYKRNFLYFTMMYNTGYMHVIFVDAQIKRGFCKWAKDNNLLQSGAEILRRLSTVAGGHADHFHMRMKCSPHYPTCQNQKESYLPKGSGCDAYGIK